MLKPYSATTPTEQFYASEIGKLSERILEPKKCVLPLKDRIDNYTSVKVVSNAAEPVNNESKKHPLEKTILTNMVTTASEDLILPVIFGELDTTNLNPIGCFDGMNTIIDNDIAAGEIAAAKGNYIDLPDNAFAFDPANPSVTAWNNLKVFVRSLDRFLRSNGIIYMPYNVYNNCMESLSHSITNKPMMSYDIFLDAIRGFANSKNLKLVVDDILGTGDRLVAQLPGNMDLGMNTQAASQFVQVRDIFEDPNIAQFWIQFEAGFRIRGVHRKVFAVSDGSAVADISFLGDYQSQS